MKIPWWISDITQAVMPELCGVCGRALAKGESTLCTGCLLDMPRTHLHKHTEPSDNPILQRTGRQAMAQRAGAYFHYEHNSPYARLLQDTKYNSMPRIARELGKRYACEIKGTGFFDGIDIIEPVPLHRLRLIKRGYNQAMEIAKGISAATGIRTGKHLVAAWHRSQTAHTAHKRMMNVIDIYSATPTAASELQGKHILLVDDIITTGSTIASCAEAFRRVVPDIRISLISLGLSRLS